MEMTSKDFPFFALPVPAKSGLLAYATAADLYESNKFKKSWKSSKKSKKSLQQSKEFKIEEDLRGLVFKRVQQVQEAWAQEFQEVQEDQVSTGVQ